MKTKRIIYFILIVIGVLFFAFGKYAPQKEYAYSVGIVLLMFGLYKSSKSWNIGDKDTKAEEEDEV